MPSSRRLRLSTISFDAVRHLVLCRIERRPPRLDMANWPHLPLAQVRTTQRRRLHEPAVRARG